MKPLPRFLLAFLAFVVSYMAVMFLFDGKELDWKRSLISALVVGALTIFGLYLFSRGKKKD